MRFSSIWADAISAFSSSVGPILNSVLKKEAIVLVLVNARSSCHVDCLLTARASSGSTVQFCTSIRNPRHGMLLGLGLMHPPNEGSIILTIPCYRTTLELMRVCESTHFSMAHYPSLALFSKKGIALCPLSVNVDGNSCILTLQLQRKGNNRPGIGLLSHLPSAHFSPHWYTS
jgi:hypothetical protein